MSFGISVTTTPAQAEAQIAADVAVYEVNANLSDDSRDSLAVAQRAALAIVDSGVFGDDPIAVTINGHANPDHRPVAGWANDTVSVSVTSLATLPPPATPAEDIPTVHDGDATVVGAPDDGRDVPAVNAQPAPAKRRRGAGTVEA